MTTPEPETVYRLRREPLATVKVVSVSIRKGRSVIVVQNLFNQRTTLSLREFHARYEIASTPNPERQ